MADTPPLFGKYVLTERIAHQRDTEIFRARSLGTDGFEKPVTVKRYGAAIVGDPRFERDVIPALLPSVGLAHANVVQVYDLGRTEDGFAVVTEFVDGPTLADVLARVRDRSAPLPVELALFVASEIARGLDHAHRRRDAQLRPLDIVHGAVTPASVWLSFDGEVKVGDFGAAALRAFDLAAGSAGRAWWSPELRRGAPADVRADVWAVGRLLAEMLGHDTSRPGREGAGALPDDVARVLTTAIADDPDARFATAARLYEELIGSLYVTGRRVAAQDLAEWLDAWSHDTVGERPAGAEGEADPHLAIWPVRDEATELAITATADPYGAIRTDRDGDALVLRFGHRVLHQDELVTAARCALRLRDDSLRNHISGELGFALAHGPSARTRAMDAALGAKRRLLITETSLAALGTAFETEAGETPDGCRVLKREKVSRHATGPRFAGQREAFQRLGEMLARASRRGLRGIVVSGDAGAGKSRFLDEVEYRLRRMNHPATWYRAACHEDDRDVPYAAVRVMLRSVLGVGPGDDLAIARAKSDRLPQLGLDDLERRAVRRVIAVPGDEESGAPSPAAVRSALVKIAEALGRDQLGVLVWDAVESMDRESHAAVLDLLRSGRAARLAVVLSVRTDEAAAWRAVRGVAEVRITPLGRDDVAQVVSDLLGLGNEGQVPAPLLDDLMARAAGNPRAIEEHMRGLREFRAVGVHEGHVEYRSRVSGEVVPVSLDGLVAAEVARLTSTARGVLELASVVGETIEHDVLADVSGLSHSHLAAAIATLVARGHLVAIDEAHSSFPHSMRRDLVHGAIEKSALARMHAAVARAIERRAGAQVDARAERIAEHYRASGQMRIAAGFFARAGRRHLTHGGYAAAVRLLGRSLEAWDAVPDAEPRLLLGLYNDLARASLHGQQVDSGSVRLGAGVVLAARTGDHRAQASLLLAIGRLLTQHNRVAPALESLQRARVVAERGGDPVVSAQIDAALGQAYMRNGEFRRAREALGDAVALAGEPRETAHALLALARCEAAAGDARSALTTWEHARGLATGIDDPVTRIEVAKARAHLAYQAREFEQSVKFSEAALEIAREAGLAYEIAVNAHNAGDAWLRLGDRRRAFASLRVSLDVAREQGFEKLERLDDLFLAYVEAMRPGSLDATERLADALAYAESNDYLWDALHAHYFLAALAVRRDDPSAARDALHAAIALASETGNRLYFEDCEALLASLDR